MTAALRAVPDAQVTVDEAVSAFLGTLDHPEHKATRKQYGSILGRLTTFLGPYEDISGVTRDDLAGWMDEAFAGLAPKTWNLSRTCLRSLGRFFASEGIAGADPWLSVAARKVPEDRDRAVPGDVLDKLLADPKIPLRDRVLWRMLLESCARQSEVLRLDVPDLDMAHNRAAVTRKGGARDVIVWQSGTAMLLPRLLKRRKSGPVFTTLIAAKPGTPLADIAPDGRGRLSARQAQATFRTATAKFPGGPWTLHGIRHRSATNAADNGASTPVLKTLGGWENDRMVAKYSRTSTAALERFQADHDPNRRR